MLWLPGTGWARRLRPDNGLQWAIDAAWIGVFASVPAVLASRLGGVPATLGVAAIIAVAGWVGGERPELRPLGARARVGLGFLVALLLSFAVRYHHAILRPLDAWWWDGRAEQLSAEPVRWSQSGFHQVALGEGGAARLEGQQGRLRTAGPVLVLVRGPVGATATAGEAQATVERDPVEREEEGPVPRYQRSGVAGLWVDGPGEQELRLEGAERAYVLPSSAAPWELEELGELRFVHYYQLLNIVENQRWAQEILDGERLVTVNQPPLWSYPLAAAQMLVDADCLGANVLFGMVLLWVGASALLLLHRLAPEAPWAAWALPGLFACIHGRLMMDPGSSNFPDSLYAAGIVGSLAAARGTSGARFAMTALGTGLLRYPGVGVAAVGAAIARNREALYKLGGALLGCLALLLGGAAVTGVLGEWVETVWFEFFPEHWRNNADASPIFARPIEFYGLWLRYTGGALLLALPLSRGARLAMGTALLYSLLLCTIDHFPSHYFLPLVALTGVAAGANAAALPRWAGEALAAAAAVGAGLFIGWGDL